MRKKLKKQLLISLCCFSLISLAVLLMPLAGERETLTQRGLNCAVGILFWSGLLSGILSWVFIHKKNRKYLSVHTDKGRRPAAVRFFSTRAAVLADSVLIVSLIGVIAGNISKQFHPAAEYIFLFLFVTALYLHFLTNSNLFHHTYRAIDCKKKLVGGKRMKEKRNIRKRLLSLLLTALMLVSVMIQPVTVMAVEPAGVRTESAETEKSGEPGETEPDADQPAEEAYAVTGCVTCGDRLAAGVHVSLRESPEKMAVTDENGEYTLENVPPGKYSVTAEKEGFTLENPVSVTVEHQPVQVQAVEMGLAVPEITCKGDFMVDGSVTYEVSTPVEGAEYNWSFSGAFSDQTATGTSVTMPVLQQGIAKASVEVTYGTASASYIPDETDCPVVPVKDTSIELIVEPGPDSKEAGITQLTLTAVVAGTQGNEGIVTFTEESGSGTFDTDNKVKLADGQAACRYKANSEDGFGGELRFTAEYSGVTNRYASSSIEVSGTYNARKDLIWCEKDVYGNDLEQNGGVLEAHVEYGSYYKDPGEEQGKGIYEIPIDTANSNVSDSKDNTYSYKLIAVKDGREEEITPINDENSQGYLDVPFSVDQYGILRIRRATRPEEDFRVKVIRKTPGYADAVGEIRVVIDRRKISLNAEETPLFSAEKVYDGTSLMEVPKFTAIQQTEQNFTRENSADRNKEAVLAQDTVKVESFEWTEKIDDGEKDVHCKEETLKPEPGQVKNVVLSSGGENYEVSLDSVPVQVKITHRDYKVRFEEAIREYGTENYIQSPALSRDPETTGFLKEDSEEAFEEIQEAVDYIDHSSISSPMCVCLDKTTESNLYIEPVIKKGCEYAGNYHITVEEEEKKSWGALIITQQKIDNPLEDPAYAEITGNGICREKEDTKEVVWIRGQYDNHEGGNLKLIPAGKTSDLYNTVLIEAGQGKNGINISEENVITVNKNKGETDENGREITYQLQKKGDGDILRAYTKKYPLVIKADSAAPTVDILNLEDPEFTMTPWEKLIAGMTFGLYVSGTYSVKVEIADGGAGVDHWSYAVADVPSDQNGDWCDFINNLPESAWKEGGKDLKQDIPVFEGTSQEAASVLENKLILIRTTDKVGNAATYLSNGVVVDNYPPQITVSDLKDNYSEMDLTEDGKIEFTVRADDTKGAQDNGKEPSGIDADAVTWNLYDGGDDITNMLTVGEEGTWEEGKIFTIEAPDDVNSDALTLKITAKDRAGNTGTYEKTFQIDTKPAIITWDYAADSCKPNTEGYAKGDVVLEVKIKDTHFDAEKTLLHYTEDGVCHEMPFAGNTDSQAGISIEAESADEDLSEYTYSLTFSGEHKYEKVWVSSTDSFGNGPSKSDEKSFTVDKTAPAVSLTYMEEDNPLHGARYFQAGREAELTVTDRNLDLKNTKITVAVKNLAGLEDKWTFSLENQGYSNDYFSAETAKAAEDAVTVYFTFKGDANYVIEELVCRDMAERTAAADVENGGTAENVTIKGVVPFDFTVDQTNPGGNVSITLEKSMWDRFVEAIAFGLFSNHNETAVSSGSDEGSGIKSIQYVVMRESLTETELRNMDADGKIDWTTENYGEGVAAEALEETLSPNRQCVVYAKITNYAERVSYLSSDGFILDNIAPEVTVTVLNPGDAENGIFNEDVRLRIDVTDPKAGETCAGLREVWYEITAAGNVNESGQGNWLLNGEETFSQEITVDADTYNSNDVRVTACAADWADNEGTAQAIPLQIDVTAPSISVSWDLNDPANGRYYNATRTATVTITDRNFDPNRTELSITNTDGAPASIGGWTVSQDMGVSDSASAVCQVSFPEDGDYTFTLNAVDLAGNSTAYGQTDEFTIDKTAPVITVAYDNNDARHGNYYKESRTAAVTINEHNFDAASVQTAITASLEGQGIAAPSLGGFSGSGDVHTATVVYDADGEYTFDIQYTDLAGNPAQEYIPDHFTVDLTAPQVNIFDIVDQSANRDRVAPGVEYTDINYDPEGVEITLTGANSGDANVESSISSIENGQRIQYSDFARTEEMDDLYTLTAKITDLAGNLTEKAVRFSVNRYGSVFVLDEASHEWLHQGGAAYRYANQETEIGVMEINVDEIDAYSIAVDRDGELKNLEEGSEFEVEKTRNEAAWRVNYYHIKAENFAEEGNYDVTITSRDKAANQVNNQTVKKSDGALPIEFTIDKTAPTVVVSGIENGGRYMADSRNMMLDVKDNLALDTVSITVGDGEPEIIRAEELREADGIISRPISSSDRYQTVRITAADAAGNVLGQEAPGDEGVDIILSVLITSNIMIQFFMNKPLFYGTIIGLLALLVLIVILIKRKRRQDPIV